MLRSLAPLVIIASVCAGLLALTESQTGSRIDENVRAHELRLITDLTGRHPPTSSGWSGNVWDLCNHSLLVRTEVPGYGGPMALLVSLVTEPQAPRLRGLRITRHQETPGLADFLAQPHSGWLSELGDRARADLQDIDAVSGATISSKAVLTGVRAAFALAADHDPAVCP
jgi:electron transport complex protein RnfG